MANDFIKIRGARENNLKNINIDIPRDKLVVITGISGSGKSSLAFDTIYAEGQRRYVESLSSYARQFLGQMDKPDVDSIDGLSPAISIDQKTTSKNPRSTVGTITEIYDYLRLLYARIGVPHCPVCGREIVKQTLDDIVDKVTELPEGTKVQILAPVIRSRKGEYQKLFEDYKKAGFTRARVDGINYDLFEEIKLDKNKKHNIEIIVDRLIIKPDSVKRITDSVETALNAAKGLVLIVTEESETLFSMSFSCPDHDISIEELEPRMFSFNNPYGACKTCSGLSVLMDIDPELVIPNRNLTIREGAIKASGWNYVCDNSIAEMYFTAIAEKYGFSLDVPVKDLPKKALDVILYGTGGEKLKMTRQNSYGSYKYENSFEGVIPNLEKRYRETSSSYVKSEIESLMSSTPCPDCNGQRLNPIALAVTIGGMNIHEYTELPISKAVEITGTLDLNNRDRLIAEPIIKEIKSRLQFLKDVGLEYLTLSRSSGTLSGGESQRIRLATQIGSSLMGVLYILDEPSIGLHQRDNAKLLETLKKLRDLGNTVIVVEHDEDTMLNADYLVDIGPGAGVFGGELIAAGTPSEVMANESSITGNYLSHRLEIPVPKARRKGNGKFLEIKGAREHNLNNIDVKIPLGKMVAVTGVSGSGKSSLVNNILSNKLLSELNGAKCKAGLHDEITGIEHLDKAIVIDQSPIGRTPRSNPATYTGVFTDIRELFAQTVDAKERGFTASRFSFNVKGGRCDACDGDGILKIEMHFLPDIYVPCEACNGKRYNRETLEVKYNGKSISDVLDMTVHEGIEFFKNVPKIRRKLQTIADVGLGYIKIAQPSTTLSGGEAQRVKLATELSKRSTGKTIYILDEPTTGLHTDDVKKLIEVLNSFVEDGNTVLVIEHNLDVIKSADHIIDLGPEGGDKGGEIVAEGTPEEVAKVSGSYTGQFLKTVLK